ncbi:hypothetical protein TrRE_jg448, partial [Triparma retinervis]
YDRDNAWEIVSGRSSSRQGRGQYDRPKPNFDFGPTGHDYVRNEKDQSELTEEKIDSINALLAERLQAKLSRDFHTADGIQVRLQEELDVIVHDGYKEWRGDGSDFAYKTAYERAGRDMSPVDEEAVQGLIRDRAKARKTRDYDAADALKLQLLSEHNVVVNDSRRTWEIKGEDTQFQDRDRPWSRGDEPGPDEAGDFASQVQALVDSRESFRIVRDYDAADVIVEKLIADFGVHLMNRDRVWTVGPYVASYRRDKFDDPAAEEDPDFPASVQAIVDARA